MRSEYQKYGCAAVACVLLLILTQTWHKVACHIFVQTCSPISLVRLAQVAFNLDTMPHRHGAGNSDTEAKLGSTADNSSTRQCTPLWSEGEDPRWALLLASPKSGSTYTQQMLNSHSHVKFGTERLLENYRECRLRPEGHCGWSDTRDHLEQIFTKYRKTAWYHEVKVVGFKIQYEHIAPELRGDFAAWLACNQINVLHLSRCAPISHPAHTPIRTYSCMTVIHTRNATITRGASHNAVACTQGRGR